MTAVSLIVIICRSFYHVIELINDDALTFLHRNRCGVIKVRLMSRSKINSAKLLQIITKRFAFICCEIFVIMLLITKYDERV